MFKNVIRNLANKSGYDFVKTANFEYGRKFKRASNDARFDYYETPVGNYYFPRSCIGDAVANAVKSGRVFDDAILNEARPFVTPGSVVLDVGANYGQMSIELSKLAADIVVYAFEAQKMVFDVLEKNIEANGIKNVKAFYNAVYDVNDQEFLFPVPDLKRFSTYGSYGLEPGSETGIPVKSLTIDSLSFDAPVSFMKIDIQGSDLAAMKGAVNTIKKYKMPIIFEYEEQFQQSFNTSFQQYVDFINDIDYKFLKTIQEINYLAVPR